jgi:hypothetical protein
VKFSTFYGTRRSITTFTRAHHWSLSWAIWYSVHHFPTKMLYCFYPVFKSCDISVSIAPIYGLDDWGCGVWFLVWPGNVSLYHHIQNGSGVHPASYAMGIRDSFPGGKAAGAWSWPLTSNLVTRSKNEELHRHSPICLNGMVLSLKKHRDNFTCTFTFIYTIFMIIMCYPIRCCMIHVQLAQYYKINPGRV